MLYREIMAVCSEIHTKYVTTLTGQNVQSHTVNATAHHSQYYAPHSTVPFLGT